ncbi:MAG: hypothetical protein H7196_04255 [candidate division SR1 bacterium]|nr:hypothetical protein [candidate division SR1 bacterium]
MKENTTIIRLLQGDQRTVKQKIQEHLDNIQKFGEFKATNMRNMEESLVKFDVNTTQIIHG